MANGWVRSLHCKSNAEHDVVKPPSTPSKKPLLPPLSCAAASSLALRDVVLFFPKYPSSSSSSKASPKPQPKPKPTPTPTPIPSSPMAAAGAGAGAGARAMVELPAGHSSRSVVEIIFGSTWSTAAANRTGLLFPGEIEVVLRVHNPALTVARFEEYRSAVRARAARSGEPRCAADGNEMMRFHCAPSCGGAPAYCSAVAPSSAAAAVAAAGRKGVRTFAGSGAAHDSAGGGGGRRAMVVSRVIAGRVRSESEPESEGESVRVGKGGLVVFDPRAILPCFLIIYKL